MIRLVCSIRTFWACRDLFLDPAATFNQLDKVVPGIRNIHVGQIHAEIMFWSVNDCAAAEKLLVEWELSNRS